MLRKLAIVLGILTLFLAACGGDGDGGGLPFGDKGDDEPTAEATIVDEEEEDAEPTEESIDEEEDGDGSGGAAEAVASLKVLTDSLSGGGALNLSGEMPAVDPALTAALLTEDEAPEGYMSFGQDFTFASESDQGPMEVAMRLFAQGDMTTGELGAMLVSAAMAVPPTSVGDFEDALEELQGTELSAEDMQEMMGELGGEGAQLTEFKMLKTPDLGDKSIGMHMVMDTSGMASETMEGMETYAAGAAMDMYVFMVGKHAFALVNVSPIDQPPSVDLLELAKKMHSRAE